MFSANLYSPVTQPLFSGCMSTKSQSLRNRGNVSFLHLFTFLPQLGTGSAHSAVYESLISLNHSFQLWLGKAFLFWSHFWLMFSISVGSLFLSLADGGDEVKT